MQKGRYPIIDMIKKITILGILFSILFTSSAFAYQFEDFRWGLKMTVAQNRLERKGKDIQTSSSYTLAYSDNIVGERCYVVLIFTPKSQKLAKVKIRWGSGSVGPALLDELTGKYGQANLNNKPMRHYEWERHIANQKLVLDYFTSAELTYFGGQYYTRFQKERQKMAEDGL